MPEKSKSSSKKPSKRLSVKKRTLKDLGPKSGSLIKGGRALSMSARATQISIKAC